MTMPTAYRITVGTSAVLLAESDLVGLAVLIRNTDPDLSIFVGGSDVLVTTGFEIRPAEGLGLTLGYDGRLLQSLYAIAADNVVVDVIVRLAS